MGRATWFDADGRKRGEWTEEEDRKLVAYIDQYGIGDWRFIPHKAGLRRCGKSCRLRWFNYLRPGIDKSKFTPQEEQTIINFHSILGNRWAAIAQEMSNRSDNDIKNHWNCCLKKRLERNGIDPITHKPFIKTPSFYSQRATSSSSTPSPSSSTSFSGSARLLNKIAASVSFRNNDVDKIKNILSVSRITNQEVEEEEEEEEKTIVNDIGQEEDDFLMWDEKRTKRFVEEIIELMEFETTSYDSIDFTSLQYDSYDENGLLDEIMHDLF